MREREEEERQEAIEEDQRRLEEVRHRHRKQRWKEEVGAQQRQREMREFQRDHGVSVPETPSPSEISLKIGTPISALSVESP